MILFMSLPDLTCSIVLSGQKQDATRISASICIATDNIDHNIRIASIPSLNYGEEVSPEVWTSQQVRRVALAAM
jgi:hypothetical protein